MCAERADFQRLDRQFQIINRAGGRRKVPDVVHRRIKKKKFGDVLLDKFEIGIPAEMRNVVHGTGDKIINADDFMAARQKQIGQMRSKKSGGAGDDGRGLFLFHQR